MIDIRTRPDIIRVPLGHPQPWWKYLPKPKDMSSAYDIPPCRSHPNQDDHFIALQDADRVLTRRTRQASKVASSVSSMSTRSTSTAMTETTLGGAGGIAQIILSEVKEMIKTLISTWISM